MVAPEVHWIAKQPDRDGFMIPLRRNNTHEIEAMMVPFVNQYFRLDLGKDDKINQIVGMG